jgi:integrase/recombinase XerD
MLTEIFPRMHRRYSSSPLLGPLLGEFAAWLIARGYPRVPLRRHLRAACRLARRWHRRGRRDLTDLHRDDLRVCAPGRSQDDADLAATSRLLERYLDEQGLLPAHAPATRVPDEVIAYGRYLIDLRGFAASTVKQHVDTAAAFLAQIAERTPGRLAGLSTHDLDRFICQTSTRLSRASLQHTVAHLRGFLRFLGTRGVVPTGLAQQIDTPRVYRQEQLPRALPWDTVRALLRSIDRRTALGRRDYAMLLLVATYGLRASEIVALTLDDIMWRRCELHVRRRKVEGPLLLPLTDAVATSVLAYVRDGRPSSPSRVLFLRHRAPAGLLKPTAVTEVFQARARRSGLAIPFQGVHCLRHSVAVHLLRMGVGLKPIGDLLGHRTFESTCLYLRLALNDLREVALDLPPAVTETTAEEARS